MTSETELRHQKILGPDFKHNFNPYIWSIRANTLKIAPSELRSVFESRGYVLEEVPWCKEGFWLETKDIITKMEEHRDGLFFSQSASSMLPPMILGPSKNDMVLDVAASPGSKTTQISAMMQNEGAIIANDVSRDRLRILRMSLDRCGCINVATALNRGEDLWKCGQKFDKILLDAPCTGTGSMNPRILKSTGEKIIHGSCKRQKLLMSSAANCLKEGGELVYSTCSLEPEENESVVSFATEKLGLKLTKTGLDVPENFSMETLSEWDGEVFGNGIENAVRIIPTEKTEGFFACKLSL